MNCPKCCGGMTSHFRTHVFAASYNEFYCYDCQIAVQFDIEDFCDMDESKLVKIGVCTDCLELDDSCDCEKEDDDE